MEHKVEKFQLSPSFTASTLPEDGATWPSYKHNKSAIMLNKTSSQLELLNKDSKLQNDKVSLDLSPDGGQLSITINGTTLNVTKNSCDITIGNFSIKLNSHLNRTPYPLSVIQPSTVAAVSLSLGNPLHIISTGDSPYVTAALSLIEGVLNEDAYLVAWSSNSQGDQFFNADQNNFYLAVDADNKIVALPGDVSDEGYIYRFKQEDIDGVQDLRYYVESDGKKYYMMVQPNGDITTLLAEDLELGSTTDTQCRFRLVV
ncbi:uncharacterized protein [Dysidea avara]|uniref:uncharacterized protein n=1 Tax=Dysidea avara TaxID=196820 RepID=UPI00333152A8